VRMTPSPSLRSQMGASQEPVLKPPDLLSLLALMTAWITLCIWRIVVILKFAESQVWTTLRDNYSVYR